ncbi:hypothetical protein CRG98_043718 [Punica granatum]|uniref:Retrotransposon gag domain-containing protein n=2 Tax=Punica granatum TaxID=22663 RepID=A0A2I0HW17_PUNGR|nr:hypothetical protein CRG98_043718 [Punica granatum]
MAKDHPERVPRGLIFNQDLLPTLQRTKEILVRLERATQALESLEWVQENYLPKRIPTFNGSVNAEEFLVWISDVDRFFDYYDIPDDGSRVDRVVYWLRGKASTWWEKLENNRLGDGRNLVFTWRRMKQLLKLEEASMKSEKLKEEEVESENEAAQASQDNNVMVEKDLAIGKMLREELNSNSAKKVQTELILNPGQVELPEEIAIEELLMVFHPIEAKFAKAYTSPPRKQQFKQRVGW